MSNIKRQIIDENQHFTDMEFIDTWGLRDRGFDYHVIAVFGSQSTGKSTLLNSLFGTQFDVMNMAAGRTQTTKGIWLSLAQQNLLIMDVEGTDGRERGEDQDFERKSALFSLATAEVVIINMWEHAVGLYQGANMALLRTVLEVNLQLFQNDSKTKTCLLFVLRDSTGVAPLETLSGTLTQDLEKAWRELNKPAGKENALLLDYFDLEFHSVAHKLYAAEKFETDVGGIREKFNEKQYLRPRYHKGIPADGFPMFAKSIWTKIETEKDLDLPSQQQLLAQYRCDEIAKSAFEKFISEIKHIKPALETAQVVSAFGKTIQLATENALHLFIKEGSRYHQATFESKKADFFVKIAGHLHVYYLQQLRNLHKKSVTEFQNLLRQRIQDDTDFAIKLDSTRNEVILSFTSHAESSKMKDCDWSYDEYLQLLVKDVDEISEAKKNEALSRVSKMLQESILHNLTEPILLVISDPPKSLWTDILELFDKTIKDSSETLEGKLLNLGIPEDQVVLEKKAVKFSCWETLQTLIQSELTESHLLDKLRNRFEKFFRYDEKGLPRIWKPSDDIDAIYSIAKSEALSLLELLSDIDFNMDTFDADIVANKAFDRNCLKIISQNRQIQAKSKLLREADSLFIEAKRSTIVSNPVIPPWFIVLTLALGWNEFLAIIRNPMLSILFLLALGASYLVWFTNLSGPVFQVAKAGTVEFLSQTKLRLKEKGFDVDPYINKFNATLNTVYHPQASNTSIEMKPVTSEDKNK